MISNCPSMTQWHAGVPRNVRWPTLFGAFVLLVWVGGFGAWAFLAPLNGAVIVSGAFVADGQNKHVQHLEGGIVQKILVREGEHVQVGQPLIQMDTTAATARLRRLEIRAERLNAMKARLNSEIANQDAVTFPASLLNAAKDNAEIAAIVAQQTTEFAARRAKMGAEIEVLQKEIAGHEESLQGYKTQISATQDQIEMFGEELKDKQDLLKSALIRKTEVLALQRSESRMTGEMGQLLGRIGDIRERIARCLQQMAQIRSTVVQRAAEETRATDTELDDIAEQIRAARDVLTRHEVVAPVRGIVVKLNHHTPGGVIQAGAVILELLPVNDDLVIESRVLASDISHVKTGQHALIRLSALNQRIVPMINGDVTYVSADAVSENRGQSTTGHSSFVVRVKLDEADLKAKAHNFRPTPGMPADLYIQTGERTFFEYLLKPVIDSFSRAFREQ